ncbi:MAG: ABC transporter permease [Verrucomicrobia bacterium]|nr:ABC transporter permease [Verrucomicrobiota bacterium]
MIPAATNVQPSPLPPASSAVSPALVAWRKLRRNTVALGCAVVLGIFALLCFFGPALMRSNYYEQDLLHALAKPSAQHWLGTDKLGRDQFARILSGGQISLLVGLAATAVAILIGVLYGAIAGYLGGKSDAVMMRAVDILYAFPLTIFVILLMVLFGRNLVLLFAAIGAVEWLTMARIVRGQVMALRHQDFVTAAISLGLRKRRIILRHLIPNVLGPIIVYTTLTIPQVMMLEAFLSFLGLGVQPPMSSWGLLIKEGAEVMEEAPWLLMYPGGLFAATLFCLNFLGDGLRDALDVRGPKE